MHTSDGGPAIPRRFAALDGWRGVCAMMVVLFHLNAGSHAWLLTRNGYVAVDFFFVLSGFVLTSGYSERLGDRSALGRFSARRLARLYPLHLATLAALLAILFVSAARRGADPFSGPFSLAALAQCLALVQGFTTNQLAWNFPSWSISIELWASLLLGSALWASGARKWWVFGLSILLLAVVVAGLGEPKGPAHDERGALLKVAHYLLAFFVGALLFRLYGSLARRRRAPPAWAEAVATAVVILTFLFADRMPAIATVTLFAAVIVVFAFEAGPVSAWLRGPAPQAAGRWSYSIYLVHPLWTIAFFQAVVAMGRWLGRPATAHDLSGERLVLGGPFVMDLVCVACLAAVLATSRLTFLFIEEPGRKLVPRRRAADRPGLAAAE